MGYSCFDHLYIYRTAPQVPILPAGDDGDRSSGTPSDLADELLRGFEIGVSWSQLIYFPAFTEGGIKI